jgi:hypothetical protein
MQFGDKRFILIFKETTEWKIEKCSFWTNNFF